MSPAKHALLFLLVVAAVLWWTTADAAGTAQPVDLLRDGDFEHGLEGWWPPSREGTFLDEEVKHGGRYSLRLERGVKVRHLSRSTPIDAGRSYRLSVWIRSQTPKRSKPVEIRALEFSHGKPVGWHREGTLLATGGQHDWRRFETVLHDFRPGTDTVAIYCRLDMGDEGTAWFDDLSLVPIPLPDFALKLSTERRANLFIGDDAPTVKAVLIGRDRSGKGTLKLQAKDFWGRPIQETNQQVDLGDAETVVEFSLPPDRGYFEIKGVLDVNGQTKATAATSLASLEPVTKEQMAASPFGSQVGDVALMPPAGMGWVRCCAYWRYLEPVKGQFDEAALRQMIAAAKAQGLKILIDFQDLPRWASSAPRGDPAWQRYPPRDWKEWAAFVEHVVRVCRGDVHVYETWNEPIIPWGWKGTLEDVYTLHRVTYDAVRRVDPTATVIGPCVCSGVIDKPEIDDFKTWLEMGLGKCIDGVSLHPYRLWRKPEAKTWRASFAEDLGRVRALAAKYDASQHLWITEIGWSTGTGEYRWETGVTERQQAEYLVRAAVFALSAGVECFITHNLTETESANPFQAGFGLLHSGARAPKPAYVAHATLSRLLSGARFLRKLSLTRPTALGYCFARDSNEVWVLWDHATDSRVSVPVAGKQVTLVDLMGRERRADVHRGTLVLDLGGEPVFVVVQR